jgi:DNA-binding Lrp family transcriptional regulator
MACVSIVFARVRTALLERPEPMKPFFVQIKCELGKAYGVATALADAEIASEIYSTAGGYDLLVKFYLADDEDVGHFINEQVHSIPGVKDTYTIITFRAF